MGVGSVGVAAGRECVFVPMSAMPGSHNGVLCVFLRQLFQGKFSAAGGVTDEDDEDDENEGGGGGVQCAQQ